MGILGNIFPIALISNLLDITIWIAPIPIFFINILQCASELKIISSGEELISVSKLYHNN
jgi:hypothetical protein